MNGVGIAGAVLVAKTEDEVDEVILLVDVEDEVARAVVDLVELADGAEETSLAPEMPLLFRARPRVLFR